MFLCFLFFLIRAFEQAEEAKKAEMAAFQRAGEIALQNFERSRKVTVIEHPPLESAHWYTTLFLNIMTVFTLILNKNCSFISLQSDICLGR